MCMHTSMYIGESSARVTGVLRDLDSVTYQERVTKGVLFSLIKRASNVDVEIGFKQRTVLQRGYSPFVPQSEDRTKEAFIRH